jgi:glycosyltransferase involved in cell wall biosynthesis
MCSNDIDYLKVSVVMGTRDEEKAIEKVIKDIKSVTGNKIEIIIVDGSKDRTPEIAERLGVKVIRQEPKGYGTAVRLALLSATRDIIITTDCDDTYPMEDIPKFVKLIEEGYDIVSGSRLAKSADTMPIFNKCGNWLFAFITSILYGIKVTDVTTGMRAYRREVIHNINWTENVGLSAELLFRPALRKCKIIEIPILYRERLGETKLNPIIGGMGIFKSILKYAIVRN